MNGKCRRWFAVLSVFFCLLASLHSQVAVQTLSHHVRPAVSSGQAKTKGVLPSTERLNLSIVLPLRNQDELKRLLGRLNDPASPDYRHFLSVEQFTEQFGPSEKDYQSVVKFAQQNGLTIRGTAKNGMLVPVSGTVSQIQKTFNVQLNVYQHPTQDRTFFAPDREPSVALATPIAHISGLNNYSIPRPLLTKASTTKPLDSSALSGSGPGGLFLGSDMRAAYYGGTELTGKGQIVGLVEFDGFNQSDVDLTFSSSGQFYSVPVEKVPVADATGAACQFTYPCSDAEQVSDIVQAIGMAPGLSQVRVYIGGGDAEVLNAIATENLAKEVSISWDWTPDDPATDDPIFEECAAQGQSVFVASGDSGTYVAGDDVYYPAESAYVTAVGATDLVTAGPAGPWSSETAWSQSGGGISPDAIPIPSWQVGVANASNGASATLRNVPDVAIEGNTDNYYCDQGLCTGSVGGTSLGAPRWASFIALVNEQGQDAGDPLVGFLNPTLYPLAAGSNTDLHDITIGNNDYHKTCNGQPYCTAVAGYDLVTGWGSPNGQALIDALAPPATKGFELSSSANILTITPGSSASTTITVVGQGGFTGNVNFTVSGLPAGISASWSANPAATSSQLTFSVGATAQRGSYSVTVTGTSGTQTATTVLTLGVNAPALAIYAAPGGLNICQGASASTSILVEDLDGFSGNVSFGITSPLPPGVTASWMPDTTTGSSMLTFNVSASTPVGTTMVTITGISGGLSATTAVSLDVVNPALFVVPSPTWLPISQGASAATTITAVPDGTPHGPVTLSADQLPAGVSVSFNPASISAGETSQVTVTTDATAPLGTYGITLQGSPQSSGDDFTFSGLGLIVTATPQPSASVSVSPEYAILPQGGSTTVNVTVNGQNGYNGSAYFYVATPPGVTASFSQNPTSSSSILTLTASATAQPGFLNMGLCYNTTANTCSGGYVDDLFVQIQPAAGFSLSSNVSSMILAPGGSSQTTITVAPQTGFRGNVQLSVISNLPQGVSASFSQNPTSSASVLTISASSAAAPGIYLLEVAGTSGSQTTTTYLRLSVAAFTTTNLTITPSTGGQNASYILAATVLTASGQPAHGQVNFCDADAAYCTDTHLLGTVQLTSAGVALLRFHPAAGTHSYKAVFLETPNSVVPYSASSSAAVSLNAKGSTTTTLAASGSPGNYTLTTTVAGAGAAAPSGAVSFSDSTQGSVTPASATLGNGTQNLTFTNPSSAISSSSPNGIVSGDFNGDGIPDLAVPNYWANVVTIFIGKGDGTFTPIQSQVPAGSQPDAIAVSDFNGDGNLDLAVANYGTNTVTILLGNGDGTFTTGSSVPTNGSQPQFLVVGDFNRDGIPDLAVANASNTLSILLGNGDGTFTATANNPATGNSPRALASGDFNGDGIMDLAVVNNGDNTVSILLGNGDGTFSAAQSYPTGSQPLGIAAADFNQDGKLDLAITNYGSGSNTVTILQGNGDGTFTALPAVSTSLNQPLGVAVADFNDDGIPDLAVTNAGNNTIEFFLGNGDGSFSTTPYTMPVGAWPMFLVTADFNQDGIPDLAVANLSSSSLSIELTQLSTSATAIATGVSVSGAGAQTIAANFPGDSNYASSVSSGISLSPESQAAAPTFSLAAGTYTSAQTVTISDSTPGAAIYYTTNGTTPTTSSTLYSGPITVSSTETIEAIATASGYSQSAIGSASYVISPAPVKTTPTVTVTPSASSITTAQALAVTVTVSGGGGNPSPTGAVTLSGGGYTSAPTTLSGGSATITIPAGSLAVGTDSLAASYPGDENYNAAAGSAAVTVTTPVNPGFSLSGTSVTVTRGATSGNTATITVTPAGGFTGGVSLTATIASSPSGAQYLPTLSFGSTSPVNISGTNSATATLTISTTAATSAALQQPKRPGLGWYADGGSVLACVLLFGLCKRRRNWLTTLSIMVVSLVVLTGSMTACGGGGGNNGSGGGGGGGNGNPGTTPGIYTITVTGTSGTLTTTDTVSLTVQ